MATKTNIYLKLLIDKSRSRVLFAEVEKDFVDFLFGLLELPLGSILQRGMIGAWSMSKVYESIQNLDPNYLQPNQTKMSLLNPKIPSSKTNQTPMLQEFGFTGQDSTHVQTTSSLFTKTNMGTTSVTFNGFGGSSCGDPKVDGYVKGSMTYMVMDDLTVKPMSTISSITILNTFQVRDLGCLEEKIVEIDTKKALKFVRASFESTTVLTDVFLTDEL